MRTDSLIARWLLLAATLLWGALAGSSQVLAAPPNDHEALAGLKEVKVIFDITTGDPKKLLSRLGLIEETRDGMIKQGVKPHFVLAFRGLASIFVQRDQSRIKLEDLDIAKQIADKVKAMSQEQGVKLEQCAVAQRYLKLKNEDTLPEIEVIGNSFISLAAYQNKGYAYIPID